MNAMRSGVVAAVLAAWVGGVSAYQDDYVTIDDDTVQCLTVGGNPVYVFTNSLIRVR